MPRYLFTGPSRTVLHGLSHGVNATLHRDAHGQPDGSTVVAQPGDEITTRRPYPHAHMQPLEPAESKPKSRKSESTDSQEQS